MVYPCQTVYINIVLPLSFSYSEFAYACLEKRGEKLVYLLSVNAYHSFAVEKFTIERVNKSGAIFDSTKLR